MSFHTTRVLSRRTYDRDGVLRLSADPLVSFDAACRWQHELTGIGLADLPFLRLALENPEAATYRAAQRMTWSGSGSSRTTPPADSWTPKTGCSFGPKSHKTAGWNSRSAWYLR
jgi:hypothetical protein